ncbi:hypothetical protein D0Y60_06245 [Shinella sp. WSJ-2]|uniref:hypothetical protein n=1 Tax=Shinella sp. WSJ-2 TaxID=2303749 RepID=UPI000E3D0C46|nr:hypothetical protein [Shinella sp. WSJ-2]RFZ88756.1 hypothetical protein D0Y60_06245 [Shinella sp. WSJ-2]
MKFCFCANMIALLMAGPADMANGQVLSTNEIIDILKDRSTILTRSITVDDIGNRKDTPDFIENATTRGLKVEERRQRDNYVATYARLLICTES